MQVQQSWLDGFTADDIQNETMQTVAYMCGLDVAVSLMQHLAGLELYIPASAKTALDLAYVRQHFSGYNAATIAGHLGINREDVIALSKVKGDLPPVLKNAHLRLIGETCGDDVVISLIKNFGGQKIYIPFNGFSTALKRGILKDFKGNNTQEVALKYGVSERYVRSVIADDHAEALQESFLSELV